MVSRARRRAPGIWATAVGTFAYCVGYGTMLGIFCAGMVGPAFAMFWPAGVLVILGFAVLLGGRFGVAVGILVGIAFVLLVGIGEYRAAQARVAAAMPWVAIVISDAATAVLFVSWSTGPFVILAEAFSTALALFGGTRIARAYLRAEEPRMRQLIH
jgi:hypothetical protein